MLLGVTFRNTVHGSGQKSVPLHSVFQQKIFFKKKFFSKWRYSRYTGTPLFKAPSHKGFSRTASVPPLKNAGTVCKWAEVVKSVGKTKIFIKIKIQRKAYNRTRGQSMGFVLTSDVCIVLAFGYDLVIDENFKLVRTTARG